MLQADLVQGLGVSKHDLRFKTKQLLGLFSRPFLLYLPHRASRKHCEGREEKGATAWSFKEWNQDRTEVPIKGSRKQRIQGRMGGEIGGKKMQATVTKSAGKRKQSRTGDKISWITDWIGWLEVHEDWLGELHKICQPYGSPDEEKSEKVRAAEYPELNQLPPGRVLYLRDTSKVWEPWTLTTPIVRRTRTHKVENAVVRKAPGYHHEIQ